MALNTLEGTWEEILQHADELAGKRLSVAVICDDDTTAEMERVPTSELFKARIGRLDFEPSNLAAQAEQEFAGIMRRKHRKGERVR